MWEVYGHCHLGYPTRPVFARCTFSMLNYLGWRPFCMTRDRVDKYDARWHDHPILTFGDCRMDWSESGQLVSVAVFGKRAKFNRNPLFEILENGSKRDRDIIDGKLTYCTQVDVCPCLSWLVWAVVCGAFGLAPLMSDGVFAFMGSCHRLQSVADMTSADVDSLVLSIFMLMPSRVPIDSRCLAVFDETPLGGSPQKETEYLSNVVYTVGVRMGLNPRKCSAVCGRKTLATAVVVHHQTKDIDAMSAFQHLCPAQTTIGCYADSSRRTADSRAQLTGSNMRELPGSVRLAHARNPSPDMVAAHQVGVAARSKTASTCGRV